MPVNKTGGYSGRSIQKAHTGLAQDGHAGSRTLQGQTTVTAPLPQPPKTVGSAPTFQNSGNNGGNKPK